MNPPQVSDIPYLYPKLVIQVRYVRKRQNVVKIPICIPNNLQLMFRHISDRFRDLFSVPLHHVLARKYQFLNLMSK